MRHSAALTQSYAISVRPGNLSKVTRPIAEFAKKSVANRAMKSSLVHKCQYAARARDATRIHSLLPPLFRPCYRGVTRAQMCWHCNTMLHLL